MTDAGELLPSGSPQIQWHGTEGGGRQKKNPEFAPFLRAIVFAAIRKAPFLTPVSVIHQ